MSNSSVIACPHCGGQITTDPRHAGNKTACPHCKRRLLAPAQGVAAKVPTPPGKVRNVDPEPIDLSQLSTVSSDPSLPVAEPVADSATHPDFDVTSLLAQPSSASSIRAVRPQPKGKAVTSIVALVAAGIFAVGITIGRLIYLAASGRLPFFESAKNDSLAKNSAKAAATTPGQNDNGKASKEPVPSRDAAKDTAHAASKEDEGQSHSAATPPAGKPAIENPPQNAEETVVKAVESIKELSAAVKTPDDCRCVAEKGLALADRAIVEGNADAAKEVAILSLAAARNADSFPLAKRATVVFLQLREPLSDSLKAIATKRLHTGVTENPRVSPQATVPSGPSLLVGDDSANGKHEVRWGKTESERRKIFYDLLKAVDDHGMTPAGRKAWSDIRQGNGIDARVTLGILNEGFGAFSDWDQPAAGGKASARINRIEWIGERTRSMTEPMLERF